MPQSFTAEAYVQPAVVQPPAFSNASNAKEAIWHLGRMLELLVFPAGNHKWRASDADPIDDGRHERGEPVVVPFRGMWQPNTQKRGRGVVDTVEAGRTEQNFIVHLDSHDPVTLAAIEASPEINALFPDGLHLHDFDAPGHENFPMAVRFRGLLYKVKQPLAFFEAGESTNPQNAMYRAECQLWEDVQHERNAVANPRVWGPETP